jgi:hypothetical protein
LLTYLLSGDGYTDMPWASEPTRKQKIAVFGVPMDFNDPSDMEKMENLFLLSYGEGIEYIDTVRAYCKKPFK